MKEESVFRDDKTLDRAIDEIQRMPVPKSPGAQLLLARLPTHLTLSDQSVPHPLRSHRSFLMRHFYQFTTAAAVLVLLAVGWLILGPPASIALAEVIEATKKHETVRYKLDTSAEIKMKLSADKEDFVPATSHDVVYFDLTTPRFRIERHEKVLNGTVQSDWVTVQDNQQDRTLVMSSLALIVTEKEAKDHNQLNAIKAFRESGDAGKIARLFRIRGDGVIPFTNMKTDKTFLEVLQTLQKHTDVVSTNDVVNGQHARRYQVTEQDMTTSLWVDVMTKLPVRIEQELLNPRPNVRRWKWVYTDFEWDNNVDNLDELFSTKPPADYALEDHTKDT